MHFAIAYLLYFIFCTSPTYAINQVDIIAPSSKEKESDLNTIKEYVEALDFHPHISKKIYSATIIHSTLTPMNLEQMI